MEARLVSVETAWKSLNKHQEELCGDMVETLKTEDSDILILTDGMGSGVKANILATLSAKILGTMFLNGAPIEDAVETIAKTLPICQERKVAYSTFSILQIYHDGSAYLAEFDNPGCVFIRNKRIVDIPAETRVIEGKEVKEYHFQVQINDCFILMSDGVIYAGAGEILNLNGWTWEAMADYTLECVKKTFSAKRLAMMLSQACDELYLGRPGDDTTIAVARVINQKKVNIFTGPPEHREDDEKVIRELMAGNGIKIVSGGVSSEIAARVLGKEVITIADTFDSEVPPISEIEGIDLVTEGVITLSKTLSLLKQYQSDDVDVDFFLKLDEANGASMLAKVLIEQCTEVHLLVGKAMNQAYKGKNLPFDLSIRMSLIEQLGEVLEQMGRGVKVSYY